MEFDRERLQEFVVSGDKSPPPVFVGREDILQDIEATSRRSWKGMASPVHGNPGETRVVQGAPGAGKSSIIAELIKKLQDKIRDSEETPSVPVPRVVNISPEMVVENLPSVLTILAGAAGLKSSVWSTLLSKVELGVTIKPDSVTPHLGWQSHKKQGPKHIWELASLFPPEKWQAPVILAIDEAQRFYGRPFTAHARFLQEIHDNKPGFPLKLVLAGLGDTAAQANAMDLTRGKTVHEIGSLPPEKVGEFMLACCRRFGIDPQGHEEKLVELAAPCEGWPRHLHFALQSLGREILKAAGDLGKVSWEDVKKEADQTRTRYYQAQQSKAMEEASALVGRVLGDLRHTTRRQDVINCISRHAGSKNGVEWQLPAEMDARTLADHLIHQGALLERADHTISFAIPSFRSYLIETGGFSLPPPSDDMIRHARNQVHIQRKALDEWREQTTLLDKEVQSVEQDITRKREELDTLGFLSFERKRQLKEDLTKGEIQLAEIRKKQRNRPPPPMPPSPKSLETARCPTTAETARKEAGDKVKIMEKQKIFFPAQSPVEKGNGPQGAPKETALFVVSDPSHVMPRDSYGRTWHHFAVWNRNDVDQLQTLKTAFPETRMVAEKELRPEWPQGIPSVQGKEAHRMMMDAGISHHMAILERKGRHQPEDNNFNSTEPERESPKPGM